MGFGLILCLFNVLNKEEYEFLEFFTVENLTRISLEHCSLYHKDIYFFPVPKVPTSDDILVDIGKEIVQ